LKKTILTAKALHHARFPLQIHPFTFITASNGSQSHFISTLNGCVTIKQLKCENTSPSHNQKRFLKSFTLDKTAAFSVTKNYLFWACLVLK